MMAAEIKKRRPPTKFWKTAALGPFTGSKSKPISVALLPKHMEIKLVGTRKVYEVAYESIFFLALRADIESKKKG